VDIVESYRIQEGKVRRKTLGTLGRRDQLPAQKIDASSSTCANWLLPRAGAASASAMRIQASRELGVALAARQLWQQLGLDEVLPGLTQTNSAPSQRRSSGSIESAQRSP